MGNSARPIELLCLVACATLTMWTVGCGSAASPSVPSETYVYVAQEQSSGPSTWTGSIAQLRVGSDGSLTSLQPASVATSAVPTSLAIHPSGKFLLENSTLGVAEYAIGSDGTLTPGPSGAIVVEPSARFTPDGHFVIAAGVQGNGLPSNTINVYSFASDGSMMPVSTSGVINGLGPITVDSSSRFVYAGSSTDNKIYEFALSADGALSPIGSVPASFGPGWLPVSAGFLYAPNNGMDGSATVFQINPADGTLVEGSTFVVCPNVSGFPITFSPSGKYAYASCAGGVSQFRVDAVSGAFTSNGPDLPGVGTITFDPSGKFAFAFTDADTVSQFSIGHDGTLSMGGNVVLSTSMLGENIASAQQ